MKDEKYFGLTEQMYLRLKSTGKSDKWIKKASNEAKKELEERNKRK